MGAASIGIKLADSKFFPVLDEGSPDSKILDLTTVRDNQTSVQINLFRDGGETVEDAEYVGTLIIEDIAEKKAGDPTIELKLSLDELNELHAEAVDLDSGSRQVLTVSLETLDQSAIFNLPDFDISAHETDIELGHDPDHENLAVQGPIPGNAPEGLFDMNNEEEEKKGGVFMPAWLCILILAVGVLALVLALLVSARVMLLNRSMQEATANAPTQVTVPVVEPAPAPEPAPEATTPPPVETTEPAPEATVTEEPVVPAAPEPAPEAEPTHYKIKWGDTLWDISESYYKTPWRYPEISKFNKIKNPNLIISGTYIDIPPK